MTSFSISQRLGAVLSVATSLLLASGCRSASVNSTASPADGLGGPQPFYRSYERAPRPYDENYQPPSPPPEILPVPGYSEPSLPPSPTTQKYRRSWLPAASKPSNDQPNTDANQTETPARGTTSGLGTAVSIPPMPPAQTIGLRSEPVPLEVLAPPVSQEFPQPGPSINPSKTSSRARNTVNSWPNAKATQSPRATAPAAEQGSAAPTGEMPLLLPPNP